MAWEYHSNLFSPLANWPLDSYVSSEFREESGRTPDLPLTISTGTYRAADVVPGLQGVWLDGSTVLIENTGDSRLRLTTNWTIAFYIRPTRYPTSSTGSEIFSHGVPNTETAESDNFLYRLLLAQTTSQVQLSWETTGQTDVDTSFSFALVNGVPYHVTVRKQGTSVSLFLNGALAETQTVADQPAGGASGKFRLGGGTTNAQLEAVVASVVVFACPLTDGQIAMLGGGGAAPSVTSQLVARNGGTPISFTDYTITDGFYRGYLSDSPCGSQYQVLDQKRGLRDVLEVRDGLVEFITPALPVGANLYLYLEPASAGLLPVQTSSFLTVVPEQMLSGVFKLRKLLGTVFKLGPLYGKKVDFPQT